MAGRGYPVHPQVLVALAALVAACATHPPRRLPPPAPPRVAPPPSPPAPADATRARRPAGAAAVPLLEENEVGEAPELPASPEMLAGLPPAPADGVATAPEPGSLLAYIGPQTPPNVAAALRLIEDGRHQMAQGHQDQALECFERSVTIDPTNAYGYYFLAQLHYTMKKYDQAVAFASRAEILSAHTDPVWLGRVYSLEGAVFEEVGRYPDARRAYLKAVEADPNNLAARVGVVRLSRQ